MNKTTNKNRKKLEQYIIGENGIGYTLGTFGRIRGEYLREQRHGFYLKLMMSGRLNEYLHQTDEECHQVMGGEAKGCL